MFERITEETFDEIYPIIVEAFPKEERRDKDEMIALMMEAENYKIYGIKKDGFEGYCGVFGIWLIEEAVFIEHFAISSAYRGDGIGGEMLDAFYEWMGKPIVIEVEQPDVEIARRRIGFYKRHGFHYSEFPYLMPPMREGDSPIPMQIMTRPNAINETEFQRYKNLLYRLVYHYEEA